ncbi:MAG: methyltransferase domain-containing protein [candidate division Zixibacteria bacterium]|nr:methyltransferase domain-containing protein [candidate division Zixibacteria bacterium]
MDKAILFGDACTYALRKGPRLSLFSEFKKLHWMYRNRMDALIEEDYTCYEGIMANVEDTFGIDLTEKQILEIGCGQLYPQAHALAQKNEVHGIDLDIVLYNWSPILIAKLLLNNGIKRTLKTTIRKLLFDGEYKSKLSKRYGGDLVKKPQFYRMNGEDLTFDDDYFDFIFSVTVFEHIEDVDKCVSEIKRVLKPDGVFSIDINLFTGITGGHNLYGKHPAETQIPPWDHLRQGLYPTNVYLNKLLLDDYKRIFRKHFSEVQFIENESTQFKDLLTDEIRQELSDYSEHELLLDMVTVQGKKTVAEPVDQQQLEFHKTGI